MGDFAEMWVSYVMNGWIRWKCSSKSGCKAISKFAPTIPWAIGTRVGNGRAAPCVTHMGTDATTETSRRINPEMPMLGGAMS